MLALKAAPDGGVYLEGLALLFTGPNDPDLQGTYFGPDTQLLLDYYPEAPLFYEHGMDKNYGTYPIGRRVKIEMRPEGIWMAHKLDPNHPLYERTKAEAQAGQLAYSSDSIEHMVKKGLARDGKLNVWPLAGCSVTKNPAEPDLGAVSVKDLYKALKSVSHRYYLGDTGHRDDDLSLDNLDVAAILAKIREREIALKASLRASNEDAMNPLQVLAQFLGLPPESTPEQIMAEVQEFLAGIDNDDPADGQMSSALGMPGATNRDCMKAIQSFVNRGMQSAQMEDDLPPMDADMPPAQQSAPEPIAKPVVPTAPAKPSTTVPTKPPITPVAPTKPVAAQAVAPIKPANNFGALQQAFSRAGKSAQPDLIPHQINTTNPDGTRTYMTGSPNVNLARTTPLMELLHDMMAAKNGQAQRYNATKSMSTGIGPTGGYILREDISKDILDPLIAQTAVLESGARQEDLDGTNVKSIPAMSTIPSAYWPGEGLTVTDSQPSYRMITLVPKALAVLVKRSFAVMNQMTPQAETQLRKEISKAMALEIDRVALMGEGGAAAGGGGTRPLGLLNISGVTSTSLGSNGRTPTFSDLTGADYRLNLANIPEGGKRGFIFAPRARNTFTSMSDSLGRPLLRGSWGDGDQKELIGYPYKTTTQIPINLTVGTNTDNSYIFFGDWEHMIVGMSPQVEITLDQRYADSLTQGILAYTFVDIQVDYAQAFQILTGVRA